MRRVPSVTRRHSRAVVDLDSERCPPITVQERLNQIGLGSYQLLLIVCIGGAQLVENLESCASMNTALSRAHSFPDWQRSLLPFVSSMGSAIGLVAAGPVSDWRGRKIVLVLALTIMIVAVILMAALPPGSVSPNAILALRFFFGLGKDMQKPAGIVLAAESCSIIARPHVVFGIETIRSLGFPLEALLLLFVMPHFGEASSDNVRLYCAMIGCSGLAMIPGVFMLRESPSFLAVKGDAVACVEVLDSIAHMNGQPPMRGAVVQTPSESQQGSPRRLDDVAGVFSGLLLSHIGLVLMLGMMDSCRAFFVQGTAYVWKDLFGLLPGQHVSASMLNLLASVAPFMGMFISERMLWIGVRQITVIVAVLASVTLACLTESPIRNSAWSLLSCILLVKLTYGPLSTCIALIKAESFPTEIRVCAFSFISVLAELTGMCGPMLVEVLKEDERASSWHPKQLNYYIIIMMSSVMLCGLLTFILPGRSGDGRQLRDFFENKVYMKRIRSDGCLRDLLEIQGSDSETEQVVPKIARPRTLPNMRRS